MTKAVVLPHALVASIGIACMAFAGCKGSGGSGGDDAGVPLGGTKICSDVFRVGTDVSSWTPKVAKTDFAYLANWNAYESLTTCVCNTASPAGCSDVCTQGSGDAGAAANFCDSGTATIDCDTCIRSVCSMNVLDCQEN